MKQRLLVATLLFSLVFTSAESRAGNCGGVVALATLSAGLIASVVISSIYAAKYSTEQNVKGYSCSTDADGDDYYEDDAGEPLQSFECCETNGDMAINCQPISEPCPPGKTGICSYGSYGWRGADWIYNDLAEAIRGGTITVAVVASIGAVFAGMGHNRLGLRGLRGLKRPLLQPAQLIPGVRQLSEVGAVALRVLSMFEPGA